MPDSGIPINGIIEGAVLLDDPTAIEGDIGIDTGISGLGAAIAIGHHAGQDTVAHHRSTRIALAGIHSAGQKAGTDLGSG